MRAPRVGLVVGAIASVLIAVATSVGVAAAALGRCQPWEGYRVLGQGGESVVLVRNRRADVSVQICHRASGRRLRPELDIGIRGNDDFDQELIGVRFRGPCRLLMGLPGGRLRLQRPAIDQHAGGVRDVAGVAPMRPLRRLRTRDRQAVGNRGLDVRPDDLRV